MTVRTLHIDGARVDGIRSLYAELNRVFMPDEDWTLGESLDALDDLLYGGFGVIDGDEPICVVWDDHAVAKRALGIDATRDYYRVKLARPDVYSVTAAETALTALDAGTGPTYFDLVVQVFAEHANIDLVLC